MNGGGPVDANACNAFAPATTTSIPIAKRPARLTVAGGGLSCAARLPRCRSR
jgi:hypothetical protein